MEWFGRESQTLIFAASASITFVFGAATLLYERFAAPSRRYFLVSTLVAVWLAGVAGHMTATGPAAVEWLRWAFIADALVGPALYWLVLLLAGARRPRVEATLWALGGAFALVGIVMGALIAGIEDFQPGNPITGGRSLSVGFLIFALACVAASVVELVVAYRRSLTTEERRRHAMVLAALAIASISFVDPFLPRAGIAVGPLLPLAVTVAVGILGVAASRYRVFAEVPAFATDEVLRTMSDAVLVLDTSGTVRGANPAAQLLVGVSEAELRGQNARDLVAASPQGDGRWWIRPGERWRDRELVLRRADGSTVDVSVSTEPLLVGGIARGTVMVARDIRARLEAERELQTAELRYRSLFWHNPALAFEFDRDGRFVNLNPSTGAVLEAEAEDMIGRPFTDVIAPVHLDAARRAFEVVLRGESTEYELDILSSRGEVRTIRGVSIPIRSGDRVDGVFGVALDVTEEGRAKRELVVQRRYFAALFDESPEPIVIVEPDGRIVQVNAEFIRMFGYAVDECVGRRIADLIVPPELRAESDGLLTQAASGRTALTDAVRERKDGTRVEVSILARELLIPGQGPQIYGIYRDISARKEAERALREREEELRHAQRLEAVGKLAGGVAHDFNNLLTVINGHARFALDALPADEPVRADLEEIERAGTRAASLTQQLLAFSRRQVLRPQVLDVSAVVRDMERMLGRLIGEHIRLETELDDTAGHVFVDRGQLEQVLVNLVVNARDAMPDGGRLLLKTDTAILDPADPELDAWGIEPGRYVRLVVEDTGIGMDAATMARAFDPFFTTKERGKGTGLGLATVFGIVKQSGGHIMPSSSLGSGSRFVVYLPAAKDPPAHEPTEAARTDGAGAPGTRTILVAEDEPAVRNLVARVLERAGYQVVTAGDGEEALERAEGLDTAADLVISDLVMPRMGGHELVGRLRSLWPGVPVLLMSGYDDAPGASPGDAAPFLPKPFTPAVLAERVGALLAG